MKKINYGHAFIHITYQALAAIYYSFGAYMLIERGFSASLAGIVISIAGLFGFIMQIVNSSFLDKSNKWNVISYSLVCSFIITIMFFDNYLIKKSGIFLAIVYIIGGGLYSSLEPLVNSFGFQFINKGIEVKFSKARAAGSISFGIVCSIFGYLSNLYSFGIVTLFGFVFCLCLMSAIIFIKREYDSYDDVDIVVKEENISFKEFFKNHKEFVVLCLFCTGIFLGYTCDDNFMLLICENVNGDTSDMGNILAFKAIIEGIAIILLTKITYRFNTKKLLMFSAFAFVVKSFLIYVSKDVLGLYISEFIQVFSFAILFPVMVEFINSIMNLKESVRGQAMFTMTISLGSILSSFFAGIISDNLGTSTMCLFAFIVSIISAIGFCLTINKVK